jgi:hypothetical protein
MSYKTIGILGGSMYLSLPIQVQNKRISYLYQNSFIHAALHES